MSNHREGPFDSLPWPERLRGRVVTPGPAARVHGYDVESDLARHYRFSELIQLCLAGELPDERASAAFEVALMFLAPSSVAEAPVHAASLARLCCAPAGNVLVVAAAVLGEQARQLLRTHAGLLRWLEAPEGPPPAEALSPGDSPESASLARMREELARRQVHCAVREHPFSREAALLVLLHTAGLRRAEQLELAWVFARLPVAVAEAMAAPPGNVRDYPVNLPRIDYTEEEP